MFIILVAAGLLAGAVKALHEAGVWNQLQTVVFDLSHVLPIDTPLGVILSGMFGYNDTPTVSELLAWVLYLLPALFLFMRGSKPAASASCRHALPLKSPLTNPEGKSLMANHSLFKLSVVACWCPRWPHAAKPRMHLQPGWQRTGGRGSASAAAASAPAVDYSAQLAAPIAEYKQYVSSELEGLLSQSKAFAAAIKAGDLKRRKACTPSPASITNGSSRLPSCSPTWTRRLMHGKTTSSKKPPTPNSPASIVWKKPCLVTTPPRARPSLPTSWWPTLPS
jgi:hypothetical protein